ncbi:hypothetical protein D3C87_2038100 [compost metagenome]
MLLLAKTFSVCGTKARPSASFRCGATVVMSRPSRWIVPEWTGTMPAIALTKVDLPAPFGPTRMTSSPLPTEKSTPRTIGRSGS